MRLFVSEYLSSGAWPEPELPSSLAREGRAMLLALLADITRLQGLSVCTTWDARLGAFPQTTDVALITVQCETVASVIEEAAAFRRLAAECDAAYVIAPELDDLLTQRVQAVLDAGGRSLNSSPAAIAACSDKWETFQRLCTLRIPTVPTARFDPATLSLPFGLPIVLKPRFGAGSQDTFLIWNADQLLAAAAHFPSDRPTTEAIVQPYIPGRSVSVAALVQSDGVVREGWPVSEQQLSTDGRFHNLGGRMPLSLDADRLIENSNLKSEICRIAACISGLRGYIGVDVILPERWEGPPLIVDINPRLTTSYLGYRALASTNLAPRILWPDLEARPIDWHKDRIEFNADGAIVRSAGRR